jgi:conjugative relaxase-like TrwC/TraI family protein
MLSIANVSSGAQAANYYEQADDYYTADRSPSQWSGRAAEALGLAGTVQPEPFRAMLDGALPNGEQLHNAAAGRRGGTDLTFSAPKSVSLQALAGGDTRLLQAHETAVARALERAESLAACRVTQDGVTTRQTTGTLAVAQFRHDLSRAADPQLHTHCVVLNVTQRADGAWRALDNEPLYRDKMLLGALYRSELAREVQALGYEVRITHGDGRFELAHVGAEALTAFSQRSAAIEAALQRQGLTREDASARQRQTAALQTRDAKQTLDRGALHAQWRERARDAGLDLDARPSAGVVADAQRVAEHGAQAVAWAVAHRMEREAVVSRADIERSALERGTGKTDLEAIGKAITQAVQRGELIAQTVPTSAGAVERFTTPAAQQREREILGLEAAGRGQVAPLMTPAAVQAALAGGRLNADQRGVVQQVLTGTDRVAGVQGRAGTGKTTALRAVHELAGAAGMKLVGVAPSAGAARELAATGIASQTVAALRAREYAGLEARTLLVVDEAGMVGARDLHGLLTAAERAGARVLLVGDSQQLKAVAAGKPFAQLQAAGMTCAPLHDIQRQQEPQLKAAVGLAAAGQVRASLQQIAPHVVEIERHPERHQQIAAHYAALDPAQRERTLIVAGTHLAREAINGQVREAIGLAGRGQEVTTLSGKDLTEAQRLRTVSYQAGDVVRADRDYPSLGMERGAFARVVEGRAGVVTLERADGKRVEWRPVQQPHLTAFTAQSRELAVGDVVRFTHNDHRAGIVNGERAVVAEIDVKKGHVLLDTADGTRLAQRLDGPLHLDHGYAQTVHSAQGRTCERVLIDAPAGSATNNESAYYVAISRATHEVRLYTDDAQRLPEALSRSDGKSAALEVDSGKASPMDSGKARADDRQTMAMG